ncbi:MAG: integrase family protein [Xanthomonadales bacterium]|nr:integrase family protein [Xanthomonadales bacterium]
MRIKNTTVARVSPPAKGYSLHWDDDLTGFGLRVTAAGARSYIVESRVNGKTRRATIGKHGVFTADQARKIAKSKLGDMAKGIDLSAERKRLKTESVTLAKAVESYLSNRVTRAGLPLKDRTKADIRYHLRTTFPDWADKPVMGITREMIQRRYSDRARRSVAQANQAMRVLKGIMNYAAAQYRAPDGRRLIVENPVDVLRDASMLRAVKPKSSMVPLEQIGRWWSAVQAKRTDPAQTLASVAAADLVALLALTGLRVGEARALKWSQIDLDGRSLSLIDTKNRTDITLPLSEVAASVLQNRPNREGWVFPARSGKGHLKDVRGQLQILAEQTGINITAHDLRRTFRAVAAACNVELWRTKALMNHKQNDDVTLAHYTDLSDVRNLKPEADRIAGYFEEQRRILEGANGVKLTASQR